MKIIVVWGLIKRCSQPVKAFEKLHSNTIRYVENPYAKKGFLVFLVINLQHSREKQVFSSPVLISCNGFVSDEQFCLSTILSKFECYSSQYSSRYISVLSAWVYIWLFARLICFSKNFPFFTFHALETQFPEFSKKFRSSFEGFMVRPAVSFDSSRLFWRSHRYYQRSLELRSNTLHLGDDHSALLLWNDKGIYFHYPALAKVYKTVSL